MKACVIDDCARPYRARGYCISHYNAILKPDRHRTTITCAECGREHVTTRTGGRYCSLDCRDAGRRRKGAQHKALVGPLAWTDPAPPAVVKPAAPKLRFYGGTCDHCQGHYVHDARVTGIVSRFCSALCSKRYHRRVWKERANRAVPIDTRLEVYARDRGICWLCNEQVNMAAPPGDGQGPSVDHVIPQSHTLIPDHRASNLRLAHMLCNALRGDRVDA